MDINAIITYALRVEQVAESLQAADCALLMAQEPAASFILSTITDALALNYTVPTRAVLQDACEARFSRMESKDRNALREPVTALIEAAYAAPVADLTPERGLELLQQLRTELDVKAAPAQSKKSKKAYPDYAIEFRATQKPLVFVSGDFYKYTGRFWERQQSPDGELDPMYVEVKTFLMNRSLPSEMRDVREVLDCLRVSLVCRVPFNNWFAPERRTNDIVLNCENGMVNLGPDAIGTPQRFDFTPEFFSVAPLPYVWDESATCSEWEQVMSAILTPPKIALIQEFMGLSFTQRVDFQRFLYVYGFEGADGKSTMVLVWKLLLSPTNYSIEPVETFSMSHSEDLQNIQGKLANFSSDASEFDRKSTNVLKRLTGGDGLSFNRKYKTRIELQAYTKFIFFSNHAPEFKEVEGGIWRRMLGVHCDRQFSVTEQDKQFTRAEFWRPKLPGILQWVLRGTRRLFQRGSFDESVVAAEREENRSASDYERAFLRENFEIDPTHKNRLIADEIHKEYQAWCKAEDVEAKPKPVFGKRIKQTFRGADNSGPTVPTQPGERSRVWTGFKRIVQLPLPPADALVAVQVVTV